MTSISQANTLKKTLWEYDAFIKGFYRDETIEKEACEKKKIRASLPHVKVLLHNKWIEKIEVVLEICFSNWRLRRDLNSNSDSNKKN